MKIGASTGGGRSWVEDDGTMGIGQYVGVAVEDVARDDPDYLRWVRDEARKPAASDEDRQVISAHLRRAGD